MRHTRVKLCLPFLGVFEKLRKATVSFVMSVRLSVHPSVHIEQLGSHWTELLYVWYMKIFRKSIEKIPSFITIGLEKRVLYVTTNIQFLSYLPQFYLEWEMLQTEVVDEIKKPILCSETCFFFENNAVYDIRWKNIVERSCHIW